MFNSMAVEGLYAANRGQLNSRSDLSQLLQRVNFFHTRSTFSQVKYTSTLQLHRHQAIVLQDC